MPLVKAARSRGRGKHAALSKTLSALSLNPSPLAAIGRLDPNGQHVSEAATGTHMPQTTWQPTHHALMHIRSVAGQGQHTFGASRVPSHDASDVASTSRHCWLALSQHCCQG